MRYNSAKIFLIVFFVFSSTSVFPFVFPDSLLSNIDENISYKIILIGDAGEPAKDIKEPVLQALKTEASINPDSTLVIFLGDNIYSNGLPAEDDPDRKEYERRIDEQINAIVEAGAKGIFIPGNHDWAQGNDECWERIIRQAEYVNGKEISNVKFLPVNGCPGPEVMDFGDQIRVIIMDSQWWFQDEHLRPAPADSLCNYCTETEVTQAVDSLLSWSQDKFVLVASHHPLSTHGPHGGYFTWQDHIFPLTNLNEYLWLPLPIIGSIYPLIRGSGVSSQDIASDNYQNFKIKVEHVLSKYSGIVYASGHEHALQILEGVNDNLYVVSGAGIWGHVEKALGEGDDTIFAGKFEGFVSLNFLKDGRIQLNVIRVINENGETENVFSMWVKE
ncbi:MAG: metallophosphoesterase [Ignavibacteriaceae bacterium]|nr:metallophosphoesterase [Ignavibacteriaceae bacterium]